MNTAPDGRGGRTTAQQTLQTALLIIVSMAFGLIVPKLAIEFLFPKLIHPKLAATE